MMNVVLVKHADVPCIDWIILNPDLCLVQLVESTPFSKETCLEDLSSGMETMFVGFTSLAKFFSPWNDTIINMYKVVPPR